MSNITLTMRSFLQNKIELEYQSYNRHLKLKNSYVTEYETTTRRKFGEEAT